MEKFAYYTDAFKKYTQFTGRANLSQFWYFILFNFVISIVINTISQKLGGLYSLIVIVPSLAIGARRLHDIGKSGWWQLLGLVAPISFFVFMFSLFGLMFSGGVLLAVAPFLVIVNFIGVGLSIWLIVLLARKGDSEENNYGPAEYHTHSNKDLEAKFTNLSDKAKDLGKKVSEKADKLADKAEDIIEDIKK